jgi:hypothetical protein
MADCHTGGRRRHVRMGRHLTNGSASHLLTEIIRATDIAADDSLPNRSPSRFPQDPDTAQYSDIPQMFLTVASQCEGRKLRCEVIKR